jgi:hypothetical protein
MSKTTVATMHEGMYQPPSGCPCWHDVKGAAAALGVSEATVRRAARRAGVKQIAGRAVAGMVELYAVYPDGVTGSGYMPYFEGADPKTGK